MLLRGSSHSFPPAPLKREQRSPVVGGNDPRSRGIVGVRGAALPSAERMPRGRVGRSLLTFLGAAVRTPSHRHHRKKSNSCCSFFYGAGGRGRTDTDFTPRDFESRASANFTTPACVRPSILTPGRKNVKRFERSAAHSPNKADVRRSGRGQIIFAPMRLSTSLAFSGVEVLKPICALPLSPAKE